MEQEEKIAYSVNPDFWWRYTKGPHKYSSLNNAMHYDTSFVMTLFLRASGHVLVEGKTIYFSDGDLLIISPHEFHRCFVNTCSEHERISLYVYPAIAKEFKIAKNVLFSAFLDRNPGECNVIPSALIRKLEIDKLFADFHLPEKDDLTADVLMKCRTVEILIRLNKAVRLNNENPEEYSKNTTVDLAIKYINSHLCEELS
ncbi:MAG: hypothetical protein IJT66_03035, partial [Clostridia bacterium]|nr:hypothetical protein [Clostridia bacterium]